MKSLQLPVTAILGACIFLIGSSGAAIAPYRGIVAIEGLGLSNGAYALIMTISSVATAVASLALGYISDKLPDRRLLVVGCSLLGALAYGLIYLSPTAPAYIAAFCLILPFGGALFSQSFSYSRAYFDHRRPNRSEFMMSALRSLFSLAWVVAPPIVGWIASAYSVFGVFAVAAVAQIVCTLVFGLLFADPATQIGTARKNGETELVKARMPGFRMLGIAGVTLLRIAIVLHLTALPLVLINDFGGTLTDVGINAAVAALLEVPLMLLWGFAATRFPKDLILVVNGLIYAAYLVLVCLAHSVHEVLLLQGLNAIATAALVSITISYTQEAIKGRLGLSTSLIDVITVIAGLASAAAFALLASPESYIAVLLAGGVLSFVGATIIGASAVLRQRAERLAAAAA